MVRGIGKLPVLMIAMFFMLLPIAAKADQVSVTQNSNMDVVLVIDDSGSMKKTDSERVALEGAKLFIDMMESTGSRVGLVGFCENFTLERELTQISSEADKESLKSDIAALKYEGDYTDIGSAIQRAVDMQMTAQDVGNKKMILFFTDGKISFEETETGAQKEAESMEMARVAPETAAENGITIYTIGLNADGTVDEALINEFASKTSGKCNIVDNASDLPQIFNDIFADFVESEIQGIGDIEITDSNAYEELGFSIPNSSVLEANIVMIINGSSAATNTEEVSPLTDIQLVRPDGSTIGADGQSVILTKSKNYNMLKLIGPQAGNWVLRIKGEQGCQVHVNLLFNYDVTLNAMGQPDQDGNLIVTALLEKNGVAVTDNDLYLQMSASANVSRSDGVVESHPLSYDGTTFSYTVNVPVESGESVNVTVHAEGANLYRDSEPFTYQNTSKPVEPILVKQQLPSPIKLDGFLRSMAQSKLDLNDYFETSDPANSIVSYNASTSDPNIAVGELNGTELTLIAQGKGSAQLSVEVTDSQGNTLAQDTVVDVSYTFGSILLLILIPIAIILLIILIVVLKILLHVEPLAGYLYWHIESNDFSTGAQEEQYDLTFASKKALISNFVMEPSLAYAGLEKIEIKGGKNESILVQNGGKSSVLVDEYGTEQGKLQVFSGGTFRILCNTEDGGESYIVIRYERDLNDFM